MIITIPETRWTYKLRFQIHAIGCMIIAIEGGVPIWFLVWNWTKHTWDGADWRGEPLK